MEESVVVTEALVMVQPTESKSAINIAAAMFDLVPKARSFQGVLDFAPGTRYEPGQDGYQVDGASASENLFVVDDIDTTSIQTGVLGKNQPFEQVAEVQVHSSGFEAQYGGATGGVVNVVTKK